MLNGFILKKRPCRICRKWFKPNPRVGEDQKTCGNPECRREWHRKKCSEWNKRNSKYFKSIYLSKKLEVVKNNSSNLKGGKLKALMIHPRFKLGLPRMEAQEVLGLPQLIIIEYIVQLLANRFQEAIRV